MPDEPSNAAPILTPDQRLRVFISSTLEELAAERRAAKAAVERLQLSPVLFELGARPHPPRDLYRAYLAQSHIFVGVYWQRYGWVAPDEAVSGLEDEYLLCGDKPKLIYVKTPAPEREARLEALLERVRNDDTASYKPFGSAAELQKLLASDLALLLTERFEASLRAPKAASSAAPAAPTPERTRPPWPSPPTPLIGRDLELSNLRALLAQDDVRLATLLGPGGIGKSRLALAVGEAAAQRGRAVFVGLAGLSDPTLVLPAVASVLGVPETEGETVLTSLQRALRDEATLLVLDNFEQVAGAAPEIGALLSGCPALKILATSRAPLHLAAEREVPVSPLEVPAAGSAFVTLRDSAAVQLFVARAQAVKPSFALTMDNAPVVAELARRLDGLPLALELAAARVKLLSPAELLKRLDKRFELLSGGARDLPSRQQTLRGTIDWSFNLLSEGERTLLLHLAAFAGGCTLEALEAVCEGANDLFTEVAALVDNNLVVQGEAEGETRFSLLESVRAYALEKLAASGDAQHVRTQHAVYFLALAEEAKAHLAGERQLVWLSRLEREHDNLRAALTWTAAQQGESHARLATALIHFWWIRGHYREGRTWLTELLEQLGPTDKLRGRALDGAGVLAWVQGDYEAARDCYEASLALQQGLADQAGMASSLGNLGIIAIEQGDLTKARTLLEQALAINRTLNNLTGLAPSLINLSLVAMHQGDLAAAREQLEEALVINQQLGDAWGVATARINLGGVVSAQGESLLAKTHFGESLRLARELGDKESLAYALEGFASVAAAQGQARRAARLGGAAEALREATGNPRPPSSGAITFQQDIELMRAELGDGQFLEVWSEGRSLPLEQALGYALEAPSQGSTLDMSELPSQNAPRH